MRKVNATPEKMVEKDGAINFGTFRVPFRNANILDSPLYSSSCKVPAFWKKFSPQGMAAFWHYHSHPLFRHGYL